MTRNLNIWKRLDKPVILIFFLLVVIGWFNIYAAVYNEEHTRIIDLSQRYGKQFIWILATFVIAVFVVVIDSRFYTFFAWFVYGFVILLLMLVLVLGKEINGARSWFQIGPLSLQPSEFAKAGTALALASYLNSRKLDLNRFRAFVISTGIIILPAILVAIQPDMGSALVYFSLFIVLFREGMSPYIFISGFIMLILFFFTILFNNLYLTVALIGIAFILAWLASRKWTIVLAGLGIFIASSAVVYLFNRIIAKSLEDDQILFIALVLSGLAYGIYFFNKKAVSVMVIYIFLLGSLVFVNSVDFAFTRILKPHQKERVEIMLGIKSDPHGTGYNVNQSIISIGSGGFAGKGYLKGTQTKFKFVPAQSTDFIFCTIGEEWGFLGSFFIISLYVVLLFRLIILAEKQRSMFSKVYGYAVASVLFVHFFINIGMAIGIVPVIGIPLPFLSYGGSSLWGFTILLFIFLRLDASRAEYLI
ncbi:MAG TPA: rod shape-determining protein RodA [Bacteroidales bacterium]|nr:rod shape-determining protein RodA [Bacteroidales bacterium]